MRVALVYDRVNKWGGAERILLALHEIWPEAPLFTAVYDPAGAPWAKDFKVIPSFLNKFPLAKANHEFYPWLAPLAFESFDFSGFDVVISIASAEAKGIVTKPETLHLCYCLTPTRYLWSGYREYFGSWVLKFLSFPVVAYLKGWDKVAARRPDVYLAISRNVQKRIKKYYGRKSEVIYPPVDTEKFKSLRVPAKKAGRQGFKEEYFLLVSRLVAYKKVGLAVEAFNKLVFPLKIIGTGSQLGKLKRMAGKSIDFLGHLTDKQLLSYYQRCQAVIFPQREDFGLVPLEAQACGRPVIAFKGGGAEETVIEGKTGLFFYPQTAEALVRAVQKFKSSKGLKSTDCRKNAEKFSQEIFKKKFKLKIEGKWRKHQKTFI